MCLPPPPQPSRQRPRRRKFRAETHRDAPSSAHQLCMTVTRTYSGTRVVGVVVMQRQELHCSRLRILRPHACSRAAWRWRVHSLDKVTAILGRAMVTPTQYCQRPGLRTQGRQRLWWPAAAPLRLRRTTTTSWAFWRSSSCYPSVPSWPTSSTSRRRRPPVRWHTRACSRRLCLRPPPQRSHVRLRPRRCKFRAGRYTETRTMQ